MKKFAVYVLKSLSSEKHYVGYTQNLMTRFRSHNALGKKGFTTRHQPWFVIRVKFYETKCEAMTREKFLKSGRSREWMQNYIDDY
ncbi:GIY-YIG nuclease family protein [Psychroflexus sp. MES1-P1E]|uniref:GIY-YIG nuclease family protein n=1 Tax=Psychroflexus sp. MES1-P1E TaxID=2058320 RepID=UPI000C7AD9E9|nr:GIY-YIG nuclease family protein [Psychroflexus sp. MES1-P1E]PKG42687.1 endonuclease [Psychroflexus sp. MES1-P1E]